MGKRKSMAEQLAELQNPAPAAGPEEDVFGEEAMLLDTDEELDEALPASRQAQEKKRLRADIDLEDDSYKAQRTSRRRVFTSTDAIPADPDNATADSSTDGSSDGDVDADTSDDAHAEGSMTPLGTSEGDDDIDDESDGDIDDGTDTAEDALPLMNDDTTQGGADAELEALEAEYAQMQAADHRATSTAPVAGAKMNHRLAKANAVKTQLKLWDAALGMRITLQKGLLLSERLPHSPVRAHACASSVDVDTAYDAAVSACTDTMSKALDLLEMLVERQSKHEDDDEAPEVGQSAAAPAERRSDASTSDSLWKDITLLEKRFAPFRDASLDRWHRKTLLSSGHAAMRSQLSAFNQSLSGQVASVMRNPERALSRVRRSKADSQRRLCEEEGSADVLEDADDPNTYDDSTFYQVLLQEFLEAADLDGAAAAALQASRKRKNVDRRASKGRKIRYNVFSKLVNFMVPDDTQDDVVVSSLFSNLFGKATAQVAT